MDLFALDQGVSTACFEAPDIDNARLKALGDGHDAVIKVLRGHRMREMLSFFDEFDAVFQLPSYFGKNWQALDECMNDADWFPSASRVILVLMESEQIFVREVDREAAMNSLWSLLRRLANDWGSSVNGRRTEVSVLLQTDR